MDANYFYGDFLYNQGDYAGAQRVWKHALTIPVNTERPVWDKARRQVIQENLAKLAAKGN
jgi:TolA-binding protein